MPAGWCQPSIHPQRLGGQPDVLAGQLTAGIQQRQPARSSLA
jgi:hypothetical protein